VEVRLHSGSGQARVCPIKPADAQEEGKPIRWVADPTQYPRRELIKEAEQRLTKMERRVDAKDN
jgi:hypothetical protein